MADKPETKKYNVMMRLDHNGKTYAPFTKAAVVELTAEEFDALSGTGAIDPNPIGEKAKN